MSNPKQLIAGRYRLDVALASGGMGVVWRGWDERLERVVAVKQIRLQPGLSAAETAAARERAMREARITARLHHPGAVPIYDVVEHDGQPCLIMQFLPSVSLQAMLRTHRTLPTVDVARIGSEVAAALTAAHRVGIVHRDVKPGNVLLAEDGSAKLTDFGISHALGDVNLTSTGMVTGTPAYLAPEVARGQSSTYASDVYSLGSTLYTATEGHPPVDNDDNAMAVLHRVASGALTPPSRSGPLTPLLLRMLDPDPAARPAMQAAWSALSSLHQEQVAMGAGSAASPTGARPPSPRPVQDSDQAQTVFATRALGGPRPRPRTRRALLTITGLAAIAAVAVGVVYVLPHSGGGSAGVPASNLGSASRAKAHTASTTRARPASSTTPARGASSTASSTSRATSPTSPSTTPTVGSTTAQLAQTVTEYYALMPNNLNAGWSRLTPAYQRSHAGGFAAYQHFWSAIQTVSTANVVAQPPDSAVATITYHYKGGRTIVERTRYGFARSGEQWLIATSSTLSSRTL